MQKETITPIKASGASYELGYKHGVLAKKRIQKLLAISLEAVKKRKDNVTDERIYSGSKKFLPYLDKYCPHLLKELKGISDGAEISFNAALFLQVRTEFLLGNAACSAFAISSQGTLNGEVIAGQNWDFYLPELNELIDVIQLEPDGLPKILMFGFVGVIGYIGLNSEGLAHFTNQLLCENWRIALPHYFLKRMLFEKKNIKECVKLVSKTEISSSANYVLADRYGKILDIEIIPGGYKSIEPTKGFIAHTNHFLAREFKPLERYLNELPDSPIRLKRLIQLIRKNYGTINVNVAKKILADHYGFPTSICRHSDNSLRTSVSIITQPERGLAHICFGNPCESKFITYRV
ncbi:MAG: C45 family peptidase [Nitrososphaerales archaeon]